MTETTLTASALNAPTYISNSKNGSQAISFSRANESYISIPEGLIDKYKFSISFGPRGSRTGIFSIRSRVLMKIISAFQWWMVN